MVAAQPTKVTLLDFFGGNDQGKDAIFESKSSPRVSPRASPPPPKSKILIGDIFGGDSESHVHSPTINDPVEFLPSPPKAPPPMGMADPLKEIPRRKSSKGRKAFAGQSGKDIAISQTRLDTSNKRPRPFSAEERNKKSHKKKLTAPRRNTTSGQPGIPPPDRPDTPNQSLLARRSPRTIESMGIRKKRQFDGMRINLTRLETIFGVIFPTLTLTYSRMLVADPAMAERRKNVKTWCYETKNPTKGINRASINVVFKEPTSTPEGLMGISLLVCHPEESIISANRTTFAGAPLDLLCTLANGGIVLKADFVDSYSDASSPKEFPPPFPLSLTHLEKTKGAPPSPRVTPGNTPLRSHVEDPSSDEDSSDDCPSPPDRHFFIEHLTFPSILQRHPALSGTRRPIMEGMRVVLAGEFTPPSPPYAIIKFLLNKLGATTILPEKQYRMADIVMCAPNFRHHDEKFDGATTASDDDELRFLLFWRRRNMDGGEKDGRQMKFRVPREKLFNDYTPIRMSNTTPYRQQCSEEVCSSIMVPSETETPDASQGPALLEPVKGKIFVKTSWLVHTIVTWQLQVPSLFLPMWLKLRSK